MPLSISLSFFVDIVVAIDIFINVVIGTDIDIDIVSIPLSNIVIDTINMSRCIDRCRCAVARLLTIVLR